MPAAAKRAEPSARKRNAAPARNSAALPPDLEHTVLTLAQSFLRDARGSAAAAVKQMARRIRMQPALALGLLELNTSLDAQVEKLILRVIEGGGHHSDDTQRLVAATSFAGQPATAGHCPGDAHRTAAGGSHATSEGDPDGGRGHRKPEAHSVAAAPAAHPPRTSGLAAVNAVAKKSLFDSVLIRGVAIGDLSFNQARSFAHLGRRETAILDGALAAIGVPPDANHPLRQLLKLAELEAIVDRADNQ